MKQVPVQLLQAILEYLARKPYIEVAGLIQNIQTIMEADNKDGKGTN